MTPTLPPSPRTKALNALPFRQVAPIDGHPKPPDKDFVIWFTARTGSTWLGSLLFSAGFPKPSEYFHPNKILRIASYLGVNSWEDYVNSVKHKRATHGLFAHEMTFQFWKMLRNEGDVMNRLDFSGPSVVLFREDIVAQAISIQLAVTSNKWHRYEGTETPQNKLRIPFDEREIRKKIRYICNLELGLKAHQDLLIPKAKFLSYETLAASGTKSIIDAFEKHAEFEADNRNEASSNYVPIRSEINQRMWDRFLIGNEQFVAEVQEQRAWLFDRKIPLPFIV